jgi:hypothetical protein
MAWGRPGGDPPRALSVWVGWPGVDMGVDMGVGGLWGSFGGEPDRE